MSGTRALERHVEEAEHATGQVLEQQRERVSGTIPRRTDAEARSLEQRISLAMESMRIIGAQGDAARRILEQAERQTAQVLPEGRDSIMRMFASMVRRSTADAFRDAERGHDAPARFYRSEAEARGHSAELLHEARQTAPPQRQSPPRPAEERGFWEGLWDGITAVFSAIGDFFAGIFRFFASPVFMIRDAIHDAVVSTNEEISREVSTEWLSEDYLGSTIYARFRRSPPVTTGESGDFFDAMGGASEARGEADALGYGYGISGTYYNGTNHITVISDEPGPAELSDPHGANRYVRNAHEQLHYASWLGGGHEIRWRGDDGNPAFCGYIQWLHEGLTELHAQQLARTHGHEPTYVSYRYETATGFYIQQIAGEETLRTAYLTGDFTEVRRRLDSSLGEGAFDRIASMRRGAEALSFLMGRMAASGIDFTQWERNPVLSGCFRAIAAAEERQ